MGRIHVVVADGHQVFADALATALAVAPELDVATADSTAAVLAWLSGSGPTHQQHAHVLLIDCDLPSGSRPGVSHRQQPDGGVESGPNSHANSSRNVGTGASPIAGPNVGPGTAAVSCGAVRTTPRLGAPPGTSPGTRPAPVITVPPVRTNEPGIAASIGEHHGEAIALAAWLRHEHPHLRVALLAAEDDPVLAARALEAGVAAWIPKGCSLKHLLAVLQGILRDETHVPPALLTGVVQELTSSHRQRDEGRRLLSLLTPRERQVLHCMVSGQGRQDVAVRLGLSPHTVRTHMQNVLGKLGVHSTLAAVALARKAGIRPAPEEPADGA